MLRRHNFLLFFTLFFLSSACVSAKSLQSNYYVEGESIMLSDLVKNPKNDTQIYRFHYTKNIKRLKADEVLALLKEHGYHNYNSVHHYIQFTKKSPIDTKYIEQSLINHYKSKYKSIKIKALHLAPRTYTKALPKSYEFGISRDSHLSNEGYCYIYTPSKKKIFFDYTLEAFITPYFTKLSIKRGSELNAINTKKKSIMLQRFSAMPIEEIAPHSLEAKRNIRIDTPLTSRDVTALYLVRRGNIVNVSLKNRGISISFSAKALQSGRKGDTIKVLNSNDKEIRVKIVGKNRAEM